MQNKENKEFRWGIIPKVPITDSYLLSLVYTPGVGQVCLDIADSADKSFELTNRASSIAVLINSNNPNSPEIQEFAENISVFLKLEKGLDAYPFILHNITAEKTSKIILNLSPTFAGFFLQGFPEDTQTEINKILGKNGVSLPVFYGNYENLKELKGLKEFNIPQGQSVFSDTLVPKEESPESIGKKSVILHKQTRGVIETSAMKILKGQSVSSIKENSVAIISDGSAVLGLGNIGAEASIPVMEGKASLFRILGCVNAFPVCLKTQNTNEIIDIITEISPILGGINLEDISAPRCFEIEEELIRRLEIPVFHDDQHGTAVVVLAGFINALKLTQKQLANTKTVINGAGAGAIAVAKLLIKYGAKNVVLCDRTGILYEGRKEGMNAFKLQMARITNPEYQKGSLSDALKGADFFIGLSAAKALSREMVKTMANKACVFALANPIPEIMPDEAIEAGAFIAGTGRSDLKNQVNNSLAFPGIFRGTLDAKAKRITDEMKINASLAIAGLITDEELDVEYIIPHALDMRVAPAVAKAVASTVMTIKS